MFETKGRFTPPFLLLVYGIALLVVHIDGFPISDFCMIDVLQNKDFANP